MTLPAEGGAITLRGRHGLAEPLELAIRFSLAPGVTSGRYPWPLRFAVRPL